MVKDALRRDCDTAPLAEIHCGQVAWMKGTSSIVLRFIAIVLVSFLAGVFYAQNRPGLLIGVCLVFATVQYVHLYRTLTSPKYTRHPPEPKIRLNLE